jgi:hypothetical protein
MERGRWWNAETRRTDVRAGAPPSAVREPIRDSRRRGIRTLAGAAVQGAEAAGSCGCPDRELAPPSPPVLTGSFELGRTYSRSQALPYAPAENARRQQEMRSALLSY